jgi:hypothetical protein
MKQLFKTVAALVAAFVLSSVAHAGKLVGCEVRNGILFAHDYLTADEMLASYLDNRGPRIMKNRILTGFQNCDQALSAHGLKKPAEKKAEVRVLGTRPTEEQIAALKPGIYKAEYCNAGRVHQLTVIYHVIGGGPLGEACTTTNTEAVFVAGV